MSELQYGLWFTIQLAQAGLLILFLIEWVKIKHRMWKMEKQVQGMKKNPERPRDVYDLLGAHLGDMMRNLK